MVRSNACQTSRSCQRWIKRRPQFRKQAQDVGEEVSRDGDFGHFGFAVPTKKEADYIGKAALEKREHSAQAWWLGTLER